MVSALCFVQCFETVGWVIISTSRPLNKSLSLTPSVLLWNNWRKKTEDQLIIELCSITNYRHLRMKLSDGIWILMYRGLACMYVNVHDAGSAVLLCYQRWVLMCIDSHLPPVVKPTSNTTSSGKSSRSSPAGIWESLVFSDVFLKTALLLICSSNAVAIVLSGSGSGLKGTSWWINKAVVQSVLGVPSGLWQWVEYPACKNTCFSTAPA